MGPVVLPAWHMHTVHQPVYVCTHVYLIHSSSSLCGLWACSYMRRYGTVYRYLVYITNWLPAYLPAWPSVYTTLFLCWAYWAYAGQVVAHEHTLMPPACPPCWPCTHAAPSTIHSLMSGVHVVHTRQLCVTSPYFMPWGCWGKGVSQEESLLHRGV